MTRTSIRVERFDLAEELSVARETPEGFLVVEAFVSRPGIYVYRNTREDELEGLGKEGEYRRELRPDSEVTSPMSLATYRSRSITVGHPRKNGKRVRVDASNVREFEVGTVDGPARVVGGRLAATLIIKDKRAIAEAKAGKRQLSPGHLSEVTVQSGVDPKYGRYDAIQSDIEINHLALVEKARGGDSLQMRLDEDVEEVREDGYSFGESLPATLADALSPAADKYTWPARWNLLVLIADAIDDQKLAAYSRQHRVLSTRDRFTAASVDLPPGITETRATEIAGGELAKRTVLVMVVAHLVRLVIDAHGPLRAAMRDGARAKAKSPLEKRLVNIEAIGNVLPHDRYDAADKERRDATRQIDDAWNDGWKRPPRSHAFAGAPVDPARPPRSARLDAVEASRPAWGEEWKRPARSEQFVRDELVHGPRNVQALEQPQSEET